MTTAASRPTPIRDRQRPSRSVECRVSATLTLLLRKDGSLSITVGQIDASSHRMKFTMLPELAGYPADVSTLGQLVLFAAEQLLEDPEAGTRGI